MGMGRAALLLLLASCATPAAPPEAERIRTLIARLADPEIEVREAAEGELERIGMSALHPLLEAERTGDAEAAGRARGILDRLEPSDWREYRDGPLCGLELQASRSERAMALVKVLRDATFSFQGNPREADLPGLVEGMLRGAGGAGMIRVSGLERLKLSEEAAIPAAECALDFLKQALRRVGMDLRLTPAGALRIDTRRAVFDLIQADPSLEMRDPEDY
jgi:hypothetical protein